MTSLPKAYDPKLIEEKWMAQWEPFLKADPYSRKEPYCIVIPPPNVTGVLHMGHALVDALQDVLIRWKRMQGFEVLWVPGTDHAGIATQTVVERHLFAKHGKRRGDFSREEFLGHVWRWKEESEGQILHQLKKLGCSCDWSRLRFTMDEGCDQAVFTCFQKMFNDGLIYRGDYLVNWDPVALTALSDDEVEHEERDSFLWHIRYPLADGSGHVVVATTRPETMLGDTAVAVHPEDQRYQGRIGKQIQLPLTDRKIPIIADPFVDPAFGSGAVKITPAHDFNDFAMAERHKLPMINILTPDAKILAGKFAGLAVEEAREAVVQELKQLGLLEKVEPHKLRVGLSYRSKAVLQPYLSKQWFVKMSHFKEPLLAAVREKRIDLVPPHWEQTYFHWIENVRDWCISRQLWWGHRIPIWYRGEEVVCARTSPGEGWTQDPDVLDTWFSSALWPLSVLGWPAKTPDLQKFYPTSVLVTGHDILFFWVARMILMGEYLAGPVPFQEVFLHGLIYGKSYWRQGKGGVVYITGEEKRKYDLGAPIPAGVESKWEKMSKSKGNILDPLEIAASYGTDALRIALCSSATQARQIDLDLRRFEEFKNFANKVWNGARFVLMHLEDLDALSGIDSAQLTLEDRWILSVLSRTISEMNQHLGAYAFDRAAVRAYEFFWNDFCAIYVELSKKALLGPLRANKQQLLAVLLLNAIRLLHPITPFITEELFSLLKAKFAHLETVDPYTRDALCALASPVLMTAPYPTPLEAPNPTIEALFSHLLEIVRVIRNLRTEMQIPPSEKTELYCSEPLPEEHQALLLALTPTAKVHFSQAMGFGATAHVGSLQLTIPLPESLKAKEKLRLEKEREKLQQLAATTEQKLSNPDFRSRAPKEVVQKLESTLAITQQQLAEIAQKLHMS